MKTTIKILLLAILLLTLVSVCKTVYLFFNYVVVKNVIKIGYINNGSTSVDFVCPDGCNYNLLLGFTNTNASMLMMKSDPHGSIRLSDNTRNVLHSSYATEYCNWLDSEKLSGVIIKPTQNHVSNLDQYLTPGKIYFLDLSSPNSEKEFSIWLHFEKKLKAKR